MPTKKAELKSFKVTAVIPTTQYGNLQPQYEIVTSSFEEAHKVALPYIEKLWAQYCSKGSELRKNEVAETEVKTSSRPSDIVLLEGTLTDSKAYYSDSVHKYWNHKTGKVQTGGSTIAHRYQSTFDKDRIAQEMADRINNREGINDNEKVSAEDIKLMWQINSEASMAFGTALHKALELYGKFYKLGLLTGANKKPAINSALHLNPALAKAVLAFFNGRENEDAVYEEFVNDDEADLCGQIDRIVVTNRKDKVCRVQDYKTNVNINKKAYGKLLAPFDSMPDTPLNGYWIQLSDYSELLKRKGWTVEAMDTLHWDGEKWTTYTKEPLDMTGVM